MEATTQEGTMTATQTEILIQNMTDAISDTLRFALVENSLEMTTTPVEIRETSDGRWAAFGIFVAELDEVHTRRYVGAFNAVEVLERVA